MIRGVDNGSVGSVIDDISRFGPQRQNIISRSCISVRNDALTQHWSQIGSRIRTSGSFGHSNAFAGCECTRECGDTRDNFAFYSTIKKDSRSRRYVRLLGRGVARKSAWCHVDQLRCLRVRQILWWSTTTCTCSVFLLLPWLIAEFFSNVVIVKRKKTSGRLCNRVSRLFYFEKATKRFDISPITEDLWSRCRTEQCLSLGL